MKKDVYNQILRSNQFQHKNDRVESDSNNNTCMYLTSTKIYSFDKALSLMSESRDRAQCYIN